MNGDGTTDFEPEPDPLETAEQAFAEQLMACLEECARGRKGLFSDYESEACEDGPCGWPEAARLRDLGLALQTAAAGLGHGNALASEFLDLCSIHGEYHPGERRLARTFLERIERGEVGTERDGVNKPW
ncbi:MAG: hypothetical protein ACRD25_00210 [Terracidiphilus sp.]